MWPPLGTKWIPILRSFIYTKFVAVFLARHHKGVGGRLGFSHAVRASSSSGPVWQYSRLFEDAYIGASL